VRHLSSAKFTIIDDVLDERAKQEEKWGVQSHPDGTGDSGSNNIAWLKRHITESKAKSGDLTWRHILDEEVAEAFAEDVLDGLREELIQVAAVALAWVEDIDRRMPSDA
jgi:hypothetical protein